MNIQAFIDKSRNIFQGREPFLRLSRTHWIVIIVLAVISSGFGIIETIAWCVPYYVLVLIIVTIERREKTNIPLKYLLLKQKGLQRQLFVAAYLKEIYADSDQADRAYALIFDQHDVNETVLKKNIRLMDDMQHYFSDHWVPPSLKQAESELDAELDEIERKWERFVESYGDKMDERDINFLRRWIQETRNEADEEIE